jgi:uncharacterized protein DUF6788
MPRASSPSRLPSPGPRIEEIRRQIASVDYVCDGSLQRRTKVCGKSGCRCALDPAARHGPYYEWSSLRGGRFVHRMLTPEQAHFLAQAVANGRRVRRLLARWNRESARAILAENQPISPEE